MGFEKHMHTVLYPSVQGLYRLSSPPAGDVSWERWWVNVWGSLARTRPSPLCEYNASLRLWMTAKRQKAENKMMINSKTNAEMDRVVRKVTKRSRESAQLTHVKNTELQFLYF